MQSKTSWINREMIKQIFRNCGWVSIVYFLALFFALPLQMMMVSQEEKAIYYLYNSQNLFSIVFEVQYLSMLVIPVLLGIFLFRYLQVKQLADFMHSIPVKRTQLFQLYYGMGAIFIILPIVLNGLLMVILFYVKDLGAIYQISDVLPWMCQTILFAFVIFGVTVLVGMVTGLSAVQGILSYILLLLPMGFLMILFYNFKYLFYGFPVDYFINKNIDKVSPLSDFGNLIHKSLSPLMIVIYLLVIAISYGLSIYFYKKRKMEAVSQAFVFPILRPIFKYGATFCSMLLFGNYFVAAHFPFGWVALGYIVGAIFGYYISEMVLQKTWRVFNEAKGLIVYAGIIVALVLFIHFDFIEYSERVPDQKDVISILFTDDSYSIGEKSETHYTNQKVIQSIQELHRKIVNDQPNLASRNQDRKTVFFEYKLADGDKVVRAYQLPIMKEYDKYYAAIYEQEEVREANEEILQVSDKQVDKVIIRARYDQKEISIVDSTEIKELLESIQADVRNQPYEDTQSKLAPIGELELMKHKKGKGYRGSFFVEFTPSHKQLRQWLIEKDYYSQIEPNADEIDYMLVLDKNELQSEEKEDINKAIRKNKETLKIESKEQIQQCLESRSEYNGDEFEYYLLIVDKSGNDSLYSFDEKLTPEFIKSQFN